MTRLSGPSKQRSSVPFPSWSGVPSLCGAAEGWGALRSLCDRVGGLLGSAGPYSRWSLGPKPSGSPSSGILPPSLSPPVLGGWGVKRPKGSFLLRWRTQSPGIPGSPRSPLGDRRSAGPITPGSPFLPGACRCFVLVGEGPVFPGSSEMKRVYGNAWWKQARLRYFDFFLCSLCSGRAVCLFR